MIGKTISHYKILEKLGAGGMGVVYKAKDTRLKRNVALKFLPVSLFENLEFKRRFIQEAQTASSLDHPNICTIHEIDETEDNQIFIVMTFYEGETLKEKIKRGTLNKIDAIDIAIQIASGLQKTHEKSIIHRDINPSNVMITEDGLVKIVDFGLAKSVEGQEKTTKGIALGTVAYMSPEQACGEEIDHRTDIWSLGVILYEMITEKLPFSGEYHQALLYSILNDSPNFDAIIDSDQYRAIGLIIKHCLMKDRDKRYQNFGELIQDLRLIDKDDAVKKSSEKIEIKPTKKDFRIAVLPVTNISPDEEDIYFADGMTEELISTLSKIRELRVIARTSVIRYKSMTKSIGEIGKELRVGHIIEGSIRKSQDKYRISIQLVDAQSEEDIWSNEYDRKFDDIFIIQSDIATQIADSLKVQLMGEDKQKIKKHMTDNMEAYRWYLKGRFFWNRRTKESLNKCVECFEKAIELDLRFALAFSGLADAYIILGDYNYLPAKEAYTYAKDAAEEALEIDKYLAQAHTSLGCLKSIYYWDWKAAESEFKKAISLNSKYATAYHWYAINFLVPKSRFNEAIKNIKNAEDLDPLSLIINTTIGLVHYFARDYDKAIEQYLKTIEMDINFEKAYFFLGWAYIEKGLNDEAISVFKKAHSISNDKPVVLAELGYLYASIGNTMKTINILDELIPRSHQIPMSPYNMYSIAAIYAALNDYDRAIDWLQHACVQHCYRLIYLNVDPKFDNIRSDPRFIDLLNRIGLNEKKEVEK
jgi:serine/threonine protein kinase/Tfp pilus assembly protein PilF